MTKITSRAQAVEMIDNALDQQLSRFAASLAAKVAANELSLDDAAEAHSVAIEKNAAARAFCLAQLDARKD